MGIGVGGGGMKGRNHCFVQLDIKGRLVFFLHCIFSYCFFNKWDERAVDFTPIFITCSTGEEVYPLLFIVSAWLQSSTTCQIKYFHSRRKQALVFSLS